MRKNQVEKERLKTESKGLTDETDLQRRDPEYRLVHPCKGGGTARRHLGIVCVIRVIWSC